MMTIVKYWGRETSGTHVIIKMWQKQFFYQWNSPFVPGGVFSEDQTRLGFCVSVLEDFLHKIHSTYRDPDPCTAVKYVYV